MAIMVCYILKELPPTSTITEINRKFMEPGHTHMESGTIHDTIEQSKKKISMDIGVPHDWINFIKTSVYKNKPMSVIEISKNKFINYGTFHKSSLVHS